MDTELKESKPKHKVLRKLGTFLAVIAAALVLFLGGNLFGFMGWFDLGPALGIKSPLTQSAAQATDEVTTRQLAARLEEAALYLDGESLYRYTQGDLDAATDAAIESLIAQSQDQHASYYSPDEFAAYDMASEGEYSGLGVVLSAVEGKATVMQVYEGSPASAAGVKVGDVILAIDDDRHDWAVEEAVTKIQRPAGESVKLLWLRDGAEIETVITLGAVNIPTVVSHLIDIEQQKLGYVYLRRFNDQSADVLKAAIESLQTAGASGLILDLRGNPGGYLTQAVDITSLFVKEGDVVQIETRNVIQKKSVSGITCTDLPLVVLMNSGSASASELVSAALKDHGRATLVGEVSYGKGTVQDLRTLSWGGALRFTIAHYMSPMGSKIDGVGVTPDISVAYTESSEGLAATDNLVSPDYIYSAGKDAQLDAALGELISKVGAGAGTAS